MGQCVSRKAAGAFAASAAVSHNRPGKMQKHQKLTSPGDDASPTTPLKPRATVASCDTNKRSGQTTKGVAMSFGFKRRGAPSIASNATAARRLATVGVGDVDGNGNDAAAVAPASEADSLTDNAVPTGRTTPRLAPPKKEASATRINRFGFRHTQSNRQNKIADLNYPSATEFGAQNNPNNNALTKKPATFAGRSMTATGNDNNNKNRMVKVGTQQPQIGKYTLQTIQLPRPESVRLIETKTAKTMANNNKRVMYQYHNQEETSSKDGSLTEDSGVGSNRSGFMGEVEQLEASPNFGARRRISQLKARNLEMVVTSKNTFDVRDMADSNGSCESIPPPPLPQLPSAFRSSSSMDNKDMSYHPTSLVRERTIEYQRHLNRDNRDRKISITSSEGFSDDYGDEKNYRDAFRSEKVFVKAVPSHQAFLKSRAEVKEDSSPPSSDEHDWAHGGEAMADEISFSLSSSDESRDKHEEDSTSTMIGTALQSLLEKNFTSNDLRNVTLTIEDQKLDAIVAAGHTGCLLDEETLLSPSDSVSYSETEEIKKKFQCTSSSDSKDVNEKLTPPSPGTPTNASNSLSLSDGKDDFLIDDEIADQPALVFEDGVKNDITISQTNSETTPTLVDTTPKSRRRNIFEGSPLSLRNKKFLHSRTGSLDTLSPCESINSDDMMMDYEYSQSSGLEECDKQSSGFPSLNDPPASKSETSELPRTHKDWNVLVGNYVNPEKSPRSHASRPRLLRSRAGTPSSVPDSPRSLDNRSANATRMSRPSVNGSPAKSRMQQHLSSSTGYDSDDSIRLDRANHKAIRQDIMSIKTMLLKLKRVMNESETHNPFESQAVLTNGLFNGLRLSDLDDSAQGQEDNDERAMLELAELRRQVLFLQGQLEDKEKTVRSLQEQMVRLANEDYHANSAPASTVSHDNQTCNAATQTERLRPISAGPSFFNGPSVDGSALVSATEPSRLQECAPSSKRPPSRLWRRPGEPPSPQRYNTPSSIPRRAKSRPRPPAGDPHAA